MTKYDIVKDSENEGKYVVVKRIRGHWRPMKNNIYLDEAQTYVQGAVDDDRWEASNRDQERIKQAPKSGFVLYDTMLIDSGYFCAGVVIVNNVVVRTAPILKYMVGWTSERVVNYCVKKRWRIVK